MDRWQERPPPPLACHRTSHDDPQHGPYFVEEFAYQQVQNGPQGMRASGVRQLVHAAGWIRAMCDTPGSPFVLYEVDEAAQREAELDSLREQVAELELQLEEAKSGPIDAEAFTNNVVSILRQEFARKPGPKAAA
jgi:hypothetical protein